MCGSTKKSFFCKLQDGNLCLKQTHHYYYQVQGQMAICSKSGVTLLFICDRLRENRAQRGVRNIEKRSIDFLKMYCFKPTEGNG